jgi:GNAT superfamily N-acetyltransferase
MQWQQGEYCLSTDVSRLDIPYIHEFLSHSYWAEGIPVGIVEAAIRGSVCFGLYKGESQIGFARVVTDKATFGYLADVFIDAGYRGLGLSKWMMTIIMSHPELQGFRTWMLGTLDAHGLYEQFGFRSPAEPQRIMMKRVPDIYRKKG